MTVISKTPLRLSLVGGGLDDPRYVAEHGGFSITATINQYVTVAVHEMFQSDAGWLLRYSETENVQETKEIQHPIIRTALEFYNVPRQTEIVSIADIPSGTGLGSSGAFTVGLCYALSKYVGLSLSARTLAAHATEIELGILGRGGGKQDAYACALGGLRELTFRKDGSVGDSIWTLDPTTRQIMADSVRLFYTGLQRNSEIILRTQSLDGLDEIAIIAEDAKKCLATGDIEGFARCTDVHWQAKRKRSDLISTPEIDDAYEMALKNGAIGGKLVGAGGAGFLMLIAEKSEALSVAMAERRFPEIQFAFEPHGTRLY